MDGFFGMFSMMGNYEERNVKNDKCDDFTLDTSEVYDMPWKYETAVAHKDFNGGDWIILEGTDTKEAALEAHAKWFEKLNNTVVDSLKDIVEELLFIREG